MCEDDPWHLSDGCQIRLFASVGSAILAAWLMSRYFLRILKLIQDTHLSMHQPLSEYFHLDAAPGIPEGADRLVVGRPLHVEAVDLDGPWSHDTLSLNLV